MISMEVEELKKQLDSKENLIKTLQDSLKLKDDQVKTIMDSMKLKDDHIKNLESSLQYKEDKIETLEKSMKLLKEQSKSAPAATVDEGALVEKEKQITGLKKEIDVLNGELGKADEDLEKLEQENEELRKGKSSASGDSSGIKINDCALLGISKEDILSKMREMLQTALHNVTICVPDITDLQALYLYEVKSSVNMKISCLINPGVEEHSSLLQEFESLDNVSIRSYEGEDRFVLVKDGAELLFAAVGNNEVYLAFHTKDSEHITILNSLIMESWLKSRKI